MANKMADKKKNTGQASRSQARGRTPSLKTRTRSDQRKNANSSQPKQASQANPNKTVDLKAENGKEQVPELVAEQSKSKGTKAENRTREQEQEQDKERDKDKDKDKRKEPASKSAKSVAAPVRRDPKELSRLARLRNTRFIRFILEAYFELRHKVTWPTFPEARNMTIVVVLLSGAVGLVLGAIDFGLLTLFQLINH